MGLQVSGVASIHQVPLAYAWRWALALWEGRPDPVALVYQPIPAMKLEGDRRVHRDGVGLVLPL